MSKEHIVAGYKGVMDLDTSLIDPKFIKDAVNQHYKDIQEYKQDQLARPTHTRYENTVLRAKRIHEQDLAAMQKKKNEKQEKQRKQDEYNKTYKDRVTTLYQMLNN